MKHTTSLIAIVGLFCATMTGRAEQGANNMGINKEPAPSGKPSSVIIENAALRLEFNRQAGGLVAITSKLTGETYAVTGDAFALETTAFRRGQPEMRQVEWTATAERVTARYTDADLTVEVAYGLRPGDHFFQKRMALSFAADAGIKQITLSHPEVALAGLERVCLRHPDFEWVLDYAQAKHGYRPVRPPESEPSRTFFGRTDKGGFFAGMEVPYDNSRLAGTAMHLGYAPNLKVKAGERLECEPMYFGVYRRGEYDRRAAEWKPAAPAVLLGQAVPPGAPAAPAKPLPLPSESAAMTAMASAILGPPRHGLMALACGWHCQMEQAAYDTEAKLEGDLRSLEFLAACGLDGVTDPHPWGGDDASLAKLREGDRYAPSPRARRFLERARELKLKVCQWPTMNNTHPWRPYGQPFRMDRPEWLRGVDGQPDARATCGTDFRRRLANCLAAGPFYDWLEQLIVAEALGTGLYDVWSMDGDFWGTDAFVNSILPVTCTAQNHEHLPGDSNYACQRRLDRLFAAVRQRYPRMYITTCRPKQDLGVWAMRDVDACFTLIESGTGGSNLAAGDEVRTASRIRVHHQFFPHWMDCALLFPSYAAGSNPPWPQGHIDYLMLSALSSAPNMWLYLPTKTGIPAADQAEIRKWLEWGRKNVAYLMVRHDLFDWPGKGVVDGSAHLLGDRGLIFLFNGTKESKSAEFALTAESTGFTGTAPVEIRQEYPAVERQEVSGPGATVSWPVPAGSVVVLRITRR
jgi:hypothetical protein